MRTTMAERTRLATQAVLFLAALGAVGGCGDDGPSCANGVAPDGSCLPEVDACVADAAGCQGGQSDARGPGGIVVDATGDASGDDVPDTGAPGDDTPHDDASPDIPPLDDVEPECQPICALELGCGPDGCGGSCGECTEDAICIEGLCSVALECAPSCNDKACGDDGCGGTCGECLDPEAPLCSNGACVPPCVPSCLGKVCGADGCGGSCGACGTGQSCDEALGLCVSGLWSCGAASFGADGICDCGCGAPDPDCADPSAAVDGCELGQKCVAGECVSLAPSGWTCSVFAFGSGNGCDCGCGAPDPDCAVPGAFVFGCALGEVCNAAGTCGACVGSCAGKACGEDGCGGICGVCDDGLACVDGACVDGCLPTPAACAHAECGEDGCGGDCGTCDALESCIAGQCVPKPGSSCFGFCKGDAPAGCSCDASCIQDGDCCPDVKEACLCTPSCAGRLCGPDGCGGICGTCDAASATPYCDGAGTCQAACTPQCAGKACGPDGCGGECGTCGGGAACNTTAGVCVPAEWTCFPFRYADGSACDCGCGVPDPDCTKFALIFGCPDGVACDTTTGLCKAAFCGSDADCAAPKWCVGHWPAGGASRLGICRVPSPAALGVGMPCFSDSGCASGICAAGTCRAPCQDDTRCDSGQRCVGFPVVSPLTQQPYGVVFGCDGAANITSQLCAKQSDCVGGSCLVTIAPKTLAPLLRCASAPEPGSEGQKCDGPGGCAVGLVCAGGVCGRPCPGGVSDCSPGATCAARVLHGGALAGAQDDVLVDACGVP
jgi:hypothetical protein